MCGLKIYSTPINEQNNHKTTDVGNFKNLNRHFVNNFRYRVVSLFRSNLSDLI